MLEKHWINPKKEKKKKKRKKKKEEEKKDLTGSLIQQTFWVCLKGLLAYSYSEVPNSKRAALCFGSNSSAKMGIYP